MTDLVSKIIAWEEGSMYESEIPEFFQSLVDSGLAWQLQGMYGRQAMAMIRAGIIHPAKKPDNPSRGEMK
jgi:hypothetical protein